MVLDVEVACGPPRGHCFLLEGLEDTKKSRRVASRSSSNRHMTEASAWPCPFREAGLLLALSRAVELLSHILRVPPPTRKAPGKKEPLVCVCV